MAAGMQQLLYIFNAAIFNRVGITVVTGALDNHMGVGLYFRKAINRNTSCESLDESKGTIVDINERLESSWAKLKIIGASIY